MAWSDRLGDFFALDDDWARPGGVISRGDIAFTLTVVAVSLLALRGYRLEASR